MGGGTPPPAPAPSSEGAVRASRFVAGTWVCDMDVYGRFFPAGPASWISSVATRPEAVRGSEGVPADRRSASRWSRMAFARSRDSSCNQGSVEAGKPGAALSSLSGEWPLELVGMAAVVKQKLVLLVVGCLGVPLRRGNPRGQAREELVRYYEYTAGMGIWIQDWIFACLKRAQKNAPSPRPSLRRTSKVSDGPGRRQAPPPSNPAGNKKDGSLGGTAGCSTTRQRLLTRGISSRFYHIFRVSYTQHRLGSRFIRKLFRIEEATTPANVRFVGLEAADRPPPLHTPPQSITVS